MTGEPHIAWVIPRQWWFCSSFYAFWLHVPPSLLGWEFQVPVIRYWRTHSEGQTSLLFAMFFKDSRYLSSSGSPSIGISSLLWFKSQQWDTPLSLSQENHRKKESSHCVHIIASTLLHSAAARCWSWIERACSVCIYISSVSLVLFSSAPGASGLYPASAFCSWAALSPKALSRSWQPRLQIC